MSKVALLVDAENISYQSLPHILTVAARQGQIILQAVYGDWNNTTLQHWREIAEENGFTLRHQTNHPNTKNSSDMRLIMDAMEVLYRIPDVDIFCLVSNDADYIPLCEKLRESSKEVIGIGYKQASDALISACDQFVLIGRGETPAQALLPVPIEMPVSPPAPQSTAQKSSKLPKIEKLLSKAFAHAPQEANNWVSLPALGSALRQIQADFEPKQYGYINLSRLLESLPEFVELTTANNTQFARLLAVQPAPHSNGATAPKAKPTELEKLLQKALAAAPQEADGWVALSALGSSLRQIQAGFKSNTYGHSTLTKLVESMPRFMEIRTKGTVKSVRLKK